MRAKALRMQVSMPRARTSILRMPSASISSLSHSMTVRHTIGIAPGGTLPGEIGEMLLRRAPRRHDLVGVFVAQLVEAEAAAFGDLARAPHRLGMVAEEAPHLRFRLQVALGIGIEAKAGLGDRAAFANAGE